MSASVRIESGIAAGTNYWVDRPVLRIGSDPQCEICVPSAELAPHTLTLEFRSGVYRAYNRSPNPVYLGSSLLPPGGVASWEDGMTATLPGDLQLVLAIDGDPRPSPRPETGADDNEYEDAPAIKGDDPAVATSEAGKKAKSNTTVQLAVIAICVFMTAGFLVLMNLDTSSTPAQNRPSFNAIVVASLDKDAKIRDLIQRLQFGQSFLIRGDSATAKQHFAGLREQLLHQKGKWPEADTKYLEDVKNYVEDQLARLP